MSEPKLRISEIFGSIQGEGIWLGTASAFIRVSGCNLRCVWCDTPYASWNPEGPVMTIAEILDATPDLPYVVLTGGEPMLFDAIEPLATAFRAAEKKITIETAGTVFRELPCDLMSISPKLRNSAPEGPEAERHERLRYAPDVLRKLISAYNYQLKFVVSSTVDVDEVDMILDELKVDSDRVMIMAEGTSADVLHARERELVEVCLSRGWRLTPRFHVDLFGNTRGT